MDDDLLEIFDDEDEPAFVDPTDTDRPWKILIVDDDKEVQLVSRMALADIRYDNRPMELIMASSAEEGRKALREQTDIAVILLDVVMETDDAGLKFAQFVRQELENAAVRIILRTGQPGQAPEQEVIVRYDINDYKEKSELTAQKLFTATIAAIRAYDHIRTLEASQDGMETIVRASSTLFQCFSMDLFSSGALNQLSALLGTDGNGILCYQESAVTEQDVDTNIVVTSATGRFIDAIGKGIQGTLDTELVDLITEAKRLKQSRYEKNYWTLHIRTPNNNEVIIVLEVGKALTDLDRRMCDVFCSKIAVGFDNLHLYEQLKLVQDSLRENEAMLREVLNSGPMGLCITNEAGELLFFNDQLGALFGIPAGQLYTANMRNFHADESAHMDLLNRIQAGGAHVVTYTKPDGGTVQALVTGHDLDFEGQKAWALWNYELSQIKASVN